MFLVHPGGPFWQKKDIGAWSIPKGEYLKDEDELAAAEREFEEETGLEPEGEFIPLGIVTQPNPLDCVKSCPSCGMFMHEERKICSRCVVSHLNLGDQSRTVTGACSALLGPVESGGMVVVFATSAGDTPR